jgi:hypothetical protein
MKKIIFFTSVLAFFIVSCQKEDYKEKEIPYWLKADIQKQEQIINESPRLMNSYGAWLRYQWKKDFYFEYHNDLSSSSPKATSYDGNTQIQVWDTTTNYYKEKCCKVYVWKAPEARDY